MSAFIFLSNLFPRVEEPGRGAFNAAFAQGLQAICLARGIRFRVVVPVAVSCWRWRGSRVTETEREGVRVTYVRYCHVPVVGRSLAAAFLRRALQNAGLAKDLQESQVLASWLYPDAVAAGGIASAGPHGYDVRLHGTDRFHLDAVGRAGVCRRTLSAARRIWVNAEGMREGLLARGIEEGRIRVLRNGLDREVFFAGEASRAPLVLWVGNFSRVKRPERALEVFAAWRSLQRKEEQDQVKLVMVGDGREWRHCRSRAADLGMADQVDFRGRLPQATLAGLMRRARLLLLTSDSEGMPNVVLEGLASGMPVVATNVGDVSRYIHDGQNGYVVEIGGSEAQTVAGLARALRQAMSQAWDPPAIAEYPVADWGQTAASLLDDCGLIAKER